MDTARAALSLAAPCCSSPPKLFSAKSCSSVVLSTDCFSPSSRSLSPVFLPQCRHQRPSFPLLLNSDDLTLMTCHLCLTLQEQTRRAEAAGAKRTGGRGASRGRSSAEEPPRLRGCSTTTPSQRLRRSMSRSLPPPAETFPPLPQRILPSALSFCLLPSIRRASAPFVRHAPQEPEAAASTARAVCEGLESLLEAFGRTKHCDMEFLCMMDQKGG